MKHISYNREQTGKCYFEDTTIFLSDTEEEYNKAKKKYDAQAKDKYYAAFTEFEDNINLNIQGGEFTGFSVTERSMTQKLTTIVLK